MFDLDSLFLESSFDDDIDDVSLRTTKEGFVWCDCAVDESEVIDTDPFEFITEAMYQNVVNANNINIAILAENYKYLRENGYEMIQEDAKEFLEKKKQAIIAFFKKLGVKISNFFSTVIKKMQELQAKFLLLFKKARERGKSGFDKLDAKDKMVPADDPDGIVKAVKRDIAAYKEGTSGGTYLPRPLKSTTWEDEIEVLKNYGKSIKAVKEIQKDIEKEINEQRKEALKDVSDKDQKKEIKSDYAKKANAVIGICKGGVSEIMTRVNAAVRIITKSIKQKPDKEEKKATGESATFLDRIEML